MIKEALSFLADELNKYLSVKLGSTTDPRLVLGNIAKVGDADNNGGNSLTNKAVLSLLNVEEDRISKSQENFSRLDDRVIYRNPKIHLNLYLLFAINKSDYGDALKWLSLIIQYFQHRNFFTHTSHPSLDINIDKLIMDLFTLNFEQVNHMWGVLGGKYLPSAMYKMRMVGIEEDLIEGGGELIKEITISNTGI